MEKDNLRLYVDLMNKYEEQAKLGMTLIFTQDEKLLMSYMKKIAIQDKEARAFLNKLNDLKPEERMIAVDNYFAKKDGKGIIITIDEIKDYKEIIDEKSKEDKNKLNYLINNYSRLGIKGIRLDDLKYIDENDEVKDVDLNDNVVPFRREEKVKEESLEDLDVPLRSNRNYDEIEEEEIIKPVPIKPKKNKKEEKNSGFISAFLLFLFTGFAGGVLATILTFLLKK